MKKGIAITGGLAAVALLILGFSLSNQDASQTQPAESVDTSTGSPILGNPDAPVTIIDFSDYQCPKCNKWVQETKPAIDKNYIESGKVNLIFMDLAVQGPDSLDAAEATYCASDQGRYWEYHDVLYNNQGSINGGWASEENLKRFASEMDLDMSSFNSCLESDKYQERVQQNVQIAREFGAKGTPTFLIVGPEGQQKIIEGPQPFSVFEKTIDDILG